MVVVAQVGAPFGIKGWVHVKPFTEPASNFQQFDRLFLGDSKDSWDLVDSIEVRKHNQGFVAQINGCENRDLAERYRGAELAVERLDLPELEAGEYYWVDVIGIRVENKDGDVLGTVSDIVENNASAVMHIEGNSKTYLIPLVRPILINVELPSRLIVDWDIDWTA